MQNSIPAAAAVLRSSATVLDALTVRNIHPPALDCVIDSLADRLHAVEVLSITNYRDPYAEEPVIPNILEGASQLHSLVFGIYLPEYMVTLLRRFGHPGNLGGVKKIRVMFSVVSEHTFVNETAWRAIDELLFRFGEPEPNVLEEVTIYTAPRNAGDLSYPDMIRPWMPLLSEKGILRIF
ncbi:hypothetical protein B0H10DRAFT_2440909 [Mycena sp. CBHHK59/15]|nr:hypothetical protein B0H10DRAFT_2440909 [Mycena sp. CBHHK59/15]